MLLDGLPNHELCQPYVRVSMGGASQCTEAKFSHSVNDVSFEKPLAIQTTLMNRKAKDLLIPLKTF